MDNVILTIFAVLIPFALLIKPMIACKGKGIRTLFVDYRHEFLLVEVLICGFLLRCVNLVGAPAGLNQDEASIGYEAFSILTTGMDRNGLTFPVHLIAWGSGQNAFYAYLCIPFIKVLGLTVFSIRLPMCIMGCVSVYVFYLVLKLLVSKKMALFGTFLFAINPWHVMKSRFALESNIFPDMILLGVFLLLLWLIKGEKVHFCFSAVLLGLSAYAYGTAYFFLPIFCVVLFVYLIITKKARIWDMIQYIAIIFLISLPIIVFVVINRIDVGSIEVLGITIPKLLVNRAEDVLNFNSGFFQTIWSNFVQGLGILVYQVDNTLWNSLPFYGTTFVILLPLWILGVGVSLFKKKIRGKMRRSETRKIDNETSTDGLGEIAVKAIEKTEKPSSNNARIGDNVFLIWLFAAFLMMFFVNDANINRLNIIWIPIIYFTVKGIDFICQLIPKAIFPLAVGVAVLGIFFAFTYFGKNYQDNIAYNFYDGYLDAIEYVEENDCEQIKVTNAINQPYISVLFQTKMSPKEYIKTREILVGYDAFQQIVKLGKYSFEQIDMDNLKANSCYITSIYDITDEVKNDKQFKITYFSYFAVIEQA